MDYPKIVWFLQTHFIEPICPVKWLQLERTSKPSTPSTVHLHICLHTMLGYLLDKLVHSWNIIAV